MTEPGQDAITFEEELPNHPETVWRALTTGPLIARWLGMEPQGFAPVPGTCFTYCTTPAGAWDGTIRCEVIEAVTGERLVYTWRSGDEANVGYGAPLDTLVTFTLTPIAGGTRLRLIHSGFHLPRNATAFESMGRGWTQCARNLRDIANDE